MRVSPPRISGDVSRAPRPPAGSPGADAHRQTGFLLGEEVEGVLAGLALEARIAGHLAGARYRKPEVAGLLLYQSRGWLSRLAALHATETGNYAAAFPLLRAAADYLAAGAAVIGGSSEEWVEWATGGGIGRAPGQHALRYDLHPFRSGEELVRDEELGRLYRIVTALALPHFGATVLLAGDGSDGERLAATFGDRDFHLGLAELLLGLLAGLGRKAAALYLGESERFGLADLEEEAAATLERLAGLTARPDRCRADFVQEGMGERLVLEGYRRAAGAAVRRVLL